MRMELRVRSNRKKTNSNLQIKLQLCPRQLLILTRVNWRDKIQMLSSYKLDHEYHLPEDHYIK